MKKLIMLVVFLASPPFAFANEFDCSLLVGKWRMDGFDYTMEAQRESYSEFFEDGTFKIVSLNATGLGKTEQVETGYWECEGKIQIIYTDTVDGESVEYRDKYKIIELNKSYQKIKHLPERCDEIISDCGKVYEYVPWG